MPKRNDIHRVLVIGSGPIVIGQAAEFDYAGTQACRSLKEEGLEVVLVNSNPATIMTDADIADCVYIEPLVAESVKKVIEKERPDSVLATLGGQTGLNLVMELAEEGYLDKMGVKIIGTQAPAIKKAEDRLAFQETMQSIGEPCIDGLVIETVEDACVFAEKIGYPVIVRPAYTLGGSGGGICRTREELETVCANGLRLSRVGQCLIEKCIAGWKEIEYEVMRDAAGNRITVCNMENLDPVGVHTGDSIVVAPSQTLADKEYQMLRTAALNIIDALGVVGGCNVQFALNPHSAQYVVIEVNPRVSRSSALASKATGYPIAKVSAKLALGYTLDEIKNSVTGKTYAAFEPTLDYIVVKIPKWPFDKFVTARRTLGTQMKATGEVMAIAATFEGGLMKAIRSLEQNVESLHLPVIDEMDDETLHKELYVVDDRRIFAIAEAMRRGTTLEEIADITAIDPWFLEGVLSLVQMEADLKKGMPDYETLLEAKRMGFTDKTIGDLCGATALQIKLLRREWGIVPDFKMVDTCAAEFEAVTPYYYSTYASQNEVSPDTTRKKIMVLGSGPIRIGQGIEFDYCSVHSVWALKEMGCETIIVNNNPETVSTDFDIADKLYFEPLTREDVGNIVDLEKPDGAVVQFGGQTAIKLTRALVEMGVPILGTSERDIDRAEDREEFDRILEQCGIPRPAGHTIFTTEQALEAAHSLGYPVLVRPSYVLGGQGMEIARTDADIIEFMRIITSLMEVKEHPILVDKYVEGQECEVDAVCDGEDILVPGIMQHLERAGVHSGDSISVYPAQTLPHDVCMKLVEHSRALARALHVKGLVNIQFIVKDGRVYVIEVNPRSSRTVPYISKVTGVPIVKLATRVILGEKLRDMGYGTGLYKKSRLVAVKMPVFSFEKLIDADTSLGPEMKSTGEVLGVSPDYAQAVYKAFLGAGFKLKRAGKVLCSVNDHDKAELTPLAAEFAKLGYRIAATPGTAAYLEANGVAAEAITDFGEHLQNLHQDEIALVVNTATHGRRPERLGFQLRRWSVERGVTCLTSLDTVKALLFCLEDALEKGFDVVDLAKI
ncbi:MAG: carbamoyl-phosphate synthase large subunit [Candidatus Spyradocola sp.]|nr:carbamoyl-phosphate synthase large subunit [Candidatus Spyradocola sp.]